jgi:hypothetical protein
MKIGLRMDEAFTIFQERITRLMKKDEDRQSQLFES